MKPSIIWPIPKGVFRRCNEHGATVIYAGQKCPACVNAKEGDKR